MTAFSRSSRPSSFFDVLRAKRPVLFHIHSLEVLVEAKMITFSDTPFELTNVIFEGPLYRLRPRVFQQFGRRLQGSPFPRVFPILPSCVQHSTTLCLRYSVTGGEPQAKAVGTSCRNIYYLHTYAMDLFIGLHLLVRAKLGICMN